MSRRAQEALTKEQLEDLLEAINDRSATGKRNLALLTLMADTGLRIGEALDLKTSDLVKEHGHLVEVKVRSGKGGKAANVAVTQRAALHLDGFAVVDNRPVEKGRMVEIRFR